MWKIVGSDEAPFTPYPEGVSRIKRIIEGQKLGTKRISGFGLIEVPPSGAFGPHVHPEREEIYYFLSGSGSIIVGDAKIPAHEGLTFYVSGEDSHGLRNEGNNPLLVLYVTATK